MKTRRVRVLVAITDDGYYIADGSGSASRAEILESVQETARNCMEPPVEFYWIEADVPVPAKPNPPTVQAKSVRRAQ